MTAHLAPADLCDLIARLVREGYPAPIGATFVLDNDVQVRPEHVEAWQQVCTESGEWTPKGKGDHYRAASLGFTVTAYRPHECAVAS